MFSRALHSAYDNLFCEHSSTCIDITATEYSSTYIDTTACSEGREHIEPPVKAVADASAGECSWLKILFAILFLPPKTTGWS